MSVTDIRHNQPSTADVARAKADLKAALDDMPIEEQEAIRDRLFDVAAHHQETGEVDPLIHFVRSLQMTARLHRNPAYRKSAEEADRDPVDTSGVSADDFMQRMRDQYA